MLLRPPMQEEKLKKRQRAERFGLETKDIIEEKKVRRGGTRLACCAAAQAGMQRPPAAVAAPSPPQAKRAERFGTGTAPGTKPAAGGDQQSDEQRKKLEERAKRFGLAT